MWPPELTQSWKDDTAAVPFTVVIQLSYINTIHSFIQKKKFLSTFNFTNKLPGNYWIYFSFWSRKEKLLCYEITSIFVSYPYLTKGFKQFIENRLNYCAIKDHSQESCIALLHSALLMKTVNYRVIKTMSKALARAWAR